MQVRTESSSNWNANEVSIVHSQFNSQNSFQKFERLSLYMYNVCTGFVLGGDKGRAGIGSEEILKKQTRVWRKYTP